MEESYPSSSVDRLAERADVVPQGCRAVLCDLHCAGADDDPDEIDRLTQSLREEILLVDDVDSVDAASAGPAPEGTRAVDVAAIGRRPGWERISAVRAGRIHEVDGADILSPGPSLLAGLRHIHEIVQEGLRH